MKYPDFPFPISAPDVERGEPVRAFAWLVLVNWEECWYRQEAARKNPGNRICKNREFAEWRG